MKPEITLKDVALNLLSLLAVGLIAASIASTAVGVYKINKKLGAFIADVEATTPIGTVYVPSTETDAVHVVGYPFVRCERTEWQHTFVLTDNTRLTLPIRGNGHYVKWKEITPQTQGK